MVLGFLFYVCLYFVMFFFNAALVGAALIRLGGGDPTTLSILITDTTKSGQQWPRAAVIALTMIATLLAVAFAAVGFAYKGRTK